METFKHRFAGRVLAEGDIYLGARGDRGVRKLVFTLPEIATDQLAYLKLDFSLPLKAPLVREAEGWAWKKPVKPPRPRALRRSRAAWPRKKRARKRSSSLSRILPVANTMALRLRPL